jgi:thiaminase/transcriptional activator TenA
MHKQSFSKQLREKTDPLWAAIFQHPFVQGIGDGSLARDRYVFFLKQDYIYLIEFSRVFALASAKAQSLLDMGYFAALLHATLNTEMELHRKTCGEFGISASELEKTEPALITLAYTNLLVKTCYEGTLPDILAVLLPCAAGYVEIGQHLKAKGLPTDPHYRNWIETYSSLEFAEFAEWLKSRLDKQTDGGTAEQQEHWYRLYLASSRFEYLFFDMSWKKEIWPGELPL